MEFLTNPWFIIFTAINIIVTIYLVIKFYYRTKEEPPLFDRLRASSISTAKKSTKENQPKKIKTENH
jgi:hypothetical protein